MTTSPQKTNAILRRFDAGEFADTISLAEQVPVGVVYAILRSERANRARKPRARTSEIPAKVAALVAAGVTKPSRIALLLDVKRQYVHQILTRNQIPVDSKRKA